MEATGQAARDQRHSRPDHVWPAGPDRFVTGKVPPPASGC
jgi:hypothetical protein